MLRKDANRGSPRHRRRAPSLPFALFLFVASRFSPVCQSCCTSDIEIEDHRPLLRKRRKEFASPGHTGVGGKNEFACPVGHGETCTSRFPGQDRDELVPPLCSVGGACRGGEARGW